MSKMPTAVLYIYFTARITQPPMRLSVTVRNYSPVYSLSPRQASFHKFRQKVTITSPLKTIHPLDFQFLPQMAHIRFHLRKWVTDILSFPIKIAHGGLRAETRGFTPTAAWSGGLPLSHLGREKLKDANTRPMRVSASSGAVAPLGCESI